MRALSYTYCCTNHNHPDKTILAELFGKIERATKKIAGDYMGKDNDRNTNE
jgi:hypothetical protein